MFTFNGNDDNVFHKPPYCDQTFPGTLNPCFARFLMLSPSLFWASFINRCNKASRAVKFCGLDEKGMVLM